MEFISVKNLSKTYKVLKKRENGKKPLFLREYEQIPAVKNITFDVKRKDIIGYIGPNGAGKSTTIKILSGILKPDSGECIVNGMIPWENRKSYVKNIGVMFGQRSQLLWDLPPKDSFELLRGIYKVEEKKYKANMDMLVSMLDLSELLNKSVRQMSLGQRIRCEMAATFIHDPSLVFLDEPTIGLDIEIKRKFHSFVKEINKTKDVTFFITTHDLDDIQSLCNRLMIINNGELFFNDTMEKLFEYDMPGLIEVELASQEDGIILPEHTTIVNQQGGKFTLEVKSNNFVGAVINQLVSANRVLKINSEKPRIENIIHRIYQSF